MAPPQNVQRIDHVAFIYWRENHQKAIDQFTKAFGITDWDGPTELTHYGVRIAQSVISGVEVLSPVDNDADTFLTAHLRAKGEGFFAAVLGVADLRASADAAEKHGFKFQKDEKGDRWLIDNMVSNKGEPAHPTWGAKLNRYDEHGFEPFNGANFYLSQIEFKD